MNQNFEQYKVAIPEGVSGDWAVKKFEISQKDADWFNFRERLKGMGRIVEAGHYTKLTRQGATIMSDTPAEIEDHLPFIRLARGNVLINGLGIGMVLRACLAKKEVKSVTVVELSTDVIGLVAPHYQDNRLKVVNANAYDYQPPRGIEYDAVWHDIWDNISSDNLPEMSKLHKKYGKRAAFQGSWCRPECQAMKRSGY